MMATANNLPRALMLGAVYDTDSGPIKLHYFSASSLLVQRLDNTTHPYRVLRRKDGKLLGQYTERGLAIESWDRWFRDGSHA